MSDPNNPPPDDDEWGPAGEDWARQQPEQPGPQGAGTPPPPPPGGAGFPPPGQQPPPYGQGGVGGPGAGQQGFPGQTIPNYLVHSILATLLCCLPTGIVGIVYASQVNTKLAQGDIVGAKKASDNAKLWSIISVAAGVLVAIVWFLVAAANSGSSEF